MKRRLEAGLQSGSVGVGFGISYTPAASRWEILEMFRVAARFGAPCFVHIRSTGGQNVEALEEVIAAAAITGAPLHVVHITSVGLTQTPKLLQMMTEARSRGIDVTTEMYPYTAAMTELESAIFDGEWQKGLGIGYGDIQWVETGERLTAESFARYRKQGGGVIMHMIPPAVVDGAIRNPLTMIASDGIMQNGKGHPRGCGLLRARPGILCAGNRDAFAHERHREDVADAGPPAGKVCARHAGQGAHPRGRRCRPGGVRCRPRARPFDI